MDEPTIRRQLADFKARLVQIDDERQALLDIVKAYETLLRTMQPPDIKNPRELVFPPARPAPSPKQPISMRGAIKRVLKESAGGPGVHSREILERAMAMGATTTAKDPVAVVDLVVLGFAQKGLVEKISPRTWRWGEGVPTEN